MDPGTGSRRHKQLTSGQDTWSARCGESRTAGAEGGLRETTGGNTGTAPAGLPYKAAWSFFDKGEPAAEEWVAGQARKILHGQARQVAAGIRRRATTYSYSTAERVGADECARYLENKTGLPRLRHRADERLAHRHRDHRGRLQAHRQGQNGHNGRKMGLEGAEAILNLRALIASGDFETTGASTSAASTNASTTPNTVTAMSRSVTSSPQKSRTLLRT